MVSIFESNFDDLCWCFQVLRCFASCCMLRCSAEEMESKTHLSSKWSQYKVSPEEQTQTLKLLEAILKFKSMQREIFISTVSYALVFWLVLVLKLSNLYWFSLGGLENANFCVFIQYICVFVCDLMLGIGVDNVIG